MQNESIWIVRDFSSIEHPVTFGLLFWQPLNCEFNMTQINKQRAMAEFVICDNKRTCLIKKVVNSIVARNFQIKFWFVFSGNCESYVIKWVTNTSSKSFIYFAYSFLRVVVDRIIIGISRKYKCHHCDCNTKLLYPLIIWK